MAGKRRLCLLPCLIFASFIIYTGRWLLENDFLLPSENHHLLAEDALRVACDSVHDSVRSLLKTYEDDLRTDFKWHHLGTKIERLQASLDNFRQATSLGLEHLPISQSDLARHDLPMDLHQLDMCGSLAGKRVTMIGGEYIYRLHLLLLQQRERAEGKSFPCQYHEFCTHHRICLPFQQFQDDTPPPRYIKPPTTQELLDTESAAVNYIVSDTLFSAGNESSLEYVLPFVDPMTGVRLRETHWLPAARKANIIILGRGPLSAPGQTYAENWSFLRHVPDYVDRSRMIMKRNRNHDDNVRMYKPVPRSSDILNAAVHLTISRFLPDIFQLLRSLGQEGIRTSRRKRLIWPSSWYRLPGRGVARTLLLHPCSGPPVKSWVQHAFSPSCSVRTSAEHVLTLQLSAFINADATDTSLLEDPWTLLFNVQVYLQNVVLRDLLPRHGIVFLPLNRPWVVDTQTRGHVYNPPDNAVDVDVDRTAAIGEAFVTGVDYVLRHLE